MKVVGKQTNSRNCIVCGMDNQFGIKAPFYNMEDGSIATIFKYNFFHQSYPGRVHGGMITSMLDELIGRVLWISEPDVYAVTTSLEVTTISWSSTNTLTFETSMLPSSVSRLIFKLDVVLIWTLGASIDAVVL